ncbi:hypothetical protein CBM2623_B90027 [Cupriavidus taiwanensis]|nr:hypothetical protein CBM2623_B90027 [Cupriavidus taiwanensis]
MNCKAVGGLSKASTPSVAYLNDEFARLIRTKIDIGDARQAWNRNACPLADECQINKRGTFTCTTIRLWILWRLPLALRERH